MLVVMVRGKLIVRVKRMMMIIIMIFIGGADINDENNANGEDSLGKSDCNDDADGGSGNGNDDGSVDGDGIFDNWCVDGGGGDEVDDGDEQTESVADDLAECDGSSKMEMKVGVMR